MTDIEQRLATELRARADSVDELPGLHHHVVVAGRRTRARRRAAAGGVAAVLVGLVVAAGALGPGRDGAAPPAETPTPSPVESELPNDVNSLPRGLPPERIWSMGESVHWGSATIDLPRGWTAARMVESAEGLLVQALTLDGRALALVRPNGVTTTLDEDDPLGLAVDERGNQAAWGTEPVAGGTPVLRVMDLQTRRTTEFELEHPADVSGWVEGRGPLFWYAVTPSRPPVVLDVDSGSLTPLAEGDELDGAPLFTAFSPATGQVAMTDGDGCLVLTDATSRATESPRCLGVGSIGAFSPAGASLAIASQDVARVLIVTGGEIVAHHPVPRGTMLAQIVYESETSQLVLVHARNGVSHVLRCVGWGQCERALSSQPGQLIRIAEP